MFARNGGARLALFLVAVGALASAFGVLVGHDGVRSPGGVLALLAIEFGAIAVALAYHLTELPNAHSTAPVRNLRDGKIEDIHPRL